MSHGVSAVCSALWNSLEHLRGSGGQSQMRTQLIWANENTTRLVLKVCNSVVVGWWNNFAILIKQVSKQMVCEVAVCFGFFCSGWWDIFQVVTKEGLFQQPAHSGLLRLSFAKQHVTGTIHKLPLFLLSDFLYFSLIKPNKKDLNVCKECYTIFK